ESLKQTLKTIEAQQQVNQLGGVLNSLGGVSGYYGLPSASSYPSPHNTPIESRSAVFYTCFNCQSHNKPQMKYCTRCGYVLNQCTLCGSPNPVGNRFCTKCGRPLAAI